MTQKLMRLDVSRNVRFTLKIQKIVYFENQGSLMLVHNDIFLNPSPSNITLFHKPPPSFSSTKTLNKITSLGMNQQSSRHSARGLEQQAQGQYGHSSRRSNIYIYVYIYYNIIYIYVIYTYIIILYIYISILKP